MSTKDLLFEEKELYWERLHDEYLFEKWKEEQKELYPDELTSQSLKSIILK